MPFPHPFMKPNAVPRMLPAALCKCTNTVHLIRLSPCQHSVYWDLQASIRTFCFSLPTHFPFTCRRQCFRDPPTPSTVSSRFTRTPSLPAARQPP